MTPIEWLAFLVLLIVGISVGLAFTLSNAAVTAAVNRLTRTYRRQKSLHLEQLQTQAVEQRRREIEQQLAGDPDGWRTVLDQILADGLAETGGRVGQEGLLDVAVEPAPRFTVAGVADGRTYLFTTSPQALRQVKILTRKDKPVALDAALHPAARVEVQAVWEHLSAKRLGDRSTVLPRQAEWFLVARQKPQQGRAK